MNALDYCPFCGADDVTLDVCITAEDRVGWMAQVVCGHCCARGGNYVDLNANQAKQDAINNWNQKCLRNKDQDDVDYFDEFDEEDMVNDPCYILAVYELSQLKLKSQKVYEKAIADLVPGVANPSDDKILKAMFLTNLDKTTGSINRKLDKLYRAGLIKV